MRTGEHARAHRMYEIWLGDFFSRLVNIFIGHFYGIYVNCIHRTPILPAYKISEINNDLWSKLNGRRFRQAQIIYSNVQKAIDRHRIPQSDRIESFNYRDCSNHRTVLCTSSVHTHTVSVQFILSIIMFWLERWSEIRCYTPILIPSNSFFPPYCVFFPWMWCTFNVCMHCYYSKREEKSHMNPCCHIISSIRLISFISDVIVQYFLYLSVWASQ